MKKIPKFKSEEDEVRFWDTHSPLDYPSEFKDVKAPFKFSPSLLRKIAKRKEERKRSLTFRIGQHEIDLAKLIAKWKGLGYQTQMRIWVVEGIHHELRTHPELEKLLVLK